MNIDGWESMRIIEKKNYEEYGKNVKWYPKMPQYRKIPHTTMHSRGALCFPLDLLLRGLVK